jgi:8-amino-7-oxononanoate synthase
MSNAQVAVDCFAEAKQLGLTSRLQQRLLQRTEEGLKRTLVACAPDSDGHVSRMGQRAVDFSSNDYLGLRSAPQIKTEFARAASVYGLGAGASHLLGGHHPEHVRLEKALCDWTGRPAAALFSSGFQAALGAFGGLAEPQDLVLADRLAHACLLDGARYAGAKLRRFAHNDPGALAELLNSTVTSGVRWLVTESVFSMDGDQAPVAVLRDLAFASGATLMLDEAHAIGVLGPQGSGLARAAGLDCESCPVLMLTFGKALGSAGAAILGSTQVIEAIINFSRPWIYTTAMPPALAAATTKAVEIARGGDGLRAQLAENIARFRAKAHAAGLVISASQTAIQPIVFGDEGVVAISSALMQLGFYVPAVRAPTVPKGSARLRVSLRANHTRAQIDALVCALAMTAHD